MTDSKNKEILVNLHCTRPRKRYIGVGMFYCSHFAIGHGDMVGVEAYVTDPPYVDPEQFPVRGIDVVAQRDDES